MKKQDPDQTCPLLGCLATVDHHHGKVTEKAYACERNLGMKCSDHDRESGSYTRCYSPRVAPKVKCAHGDALRVKFDGGRRTILCDSCETILGYLPGDQSLRDSRIVAWEEICAHQIFKDCYEEKAPLIKAMVSKLDSVIGGLPENSLTRPTLRPLAVDDYRAAQKAWEVSPSWRTAGVRRDVIAVANAIHARLADDCEPAPAEDGGIAAWEAIAAHPIFAPCYATSAPLLLSMLDRLDGLAAQRPALRPLTEDDYLAARYAHARAERSYVNAAVDAVYARLAADCEPAPAEPEDPCVALVLEWLDDTVDDRRRYPDETVRDLLARLDAARTHHA